MEEPVPLPHHVLTRRQLLAATASGLGVAAIANGSVAAVPSPVGRSPAVVDAPWTAYFGAAQDKPVWSSVQRGGTFLTKAGNLNAWRLRRHLRTHELLSWGAPHPSLRSFEGVSGFMDGVRDSSGVWWRDRTSQWVAGLITAHANSPHKVVALSTGNEINAVGLRDNIAWWAETRNLPFPHPRSNYGDGSRPHGRDHIGYYVEYLLAPAVEGAQLANDGKPPDDRIPVLAGTMVGARHPNLRDLFLPALLDYEIEGAFAPTLAGKTVKEVVDYIGLHYLLTPEKIFGYAESDGSPLPYGHRQALDDLHNRWVGAGTIRGIWQTEEGGNATHKADRHASIAVRIFGRTMSWVLDRGVSPDEIRIIGCYNGPPGGWDHYEPREETSWRFAMGTIHDFLGHDTRLINRSTAVTAVVDDPTENYAFETSDGTRRVVVVTPQSATWQGATTLISVSIATDGWSPIDNVTAQGHLFKSDAEGYRTFPVPVVHDGALDRYEMVLPTPIALNSNLDMQSLLLAVRKGSG